MALQIPRRSFGPRVDERVATPEINKKAFSSVADAMRNLGATAMGITDDLLRIKKQEEATNFVSKARQEYELSQLDAKQDFEKNIDPTTGRDSRTGKTYTEAMKEWSESRIEQLSSKAPSDLARNRFKERITPIQTKDIIKADMHETAVLRAADMEMDNKISEGYAMSVLSAKNRQLSVGEDHYGAIVELYTSKIGTSYSPTEAQALIKKDTNTLALSTGQSAVRNKQIGELTNLLHGTLKNSGISIKGLDASKLEDREPSILEEALTPQQKNSLLNDLERLIQEDSVEKMQRISMTEEILSNTIAKGEYEPANPKHRGMVKSLLDQTFNYRDTKGRPLPWQTSVKNFTTAYWNGEVIDHLKKNPFENPTKLDQVLKGRADIVSKKVRDGMHTLYGDDLKNIPEDKYKNIVTAQIQDAYRNLMAKRQEHLTKDPGGYVIENDRVMFDKFNSVNWANPQSIINSDLLGYIQTSMQKQLSAGAPISSIDPLPKGAYSVIANEANRILKFSDPLSGDLISYVGAFKSALGDEQFDAFVNNLTDQDKDVGAVFRVGGFKARAGEPEPEAFKMMSRFAIPEQRDAILEDLKSKELSVDKLKILAQEKLIPTGFFSFAKDEYGGAFKPTLSDISGIPEMRNVREEIAKMAAVGISEGLDPDDAIDKAFEKRFQGKVFVKENESMILMNKGNNKYTPEELRTVIDRTSDVEGLAKINMGPKNYEELSTILNRAPEVKEGILRSVKQKLKRPPIDNRIVPSIEPAPDFDTPEGKKILEESAYNFFKSNYVVRWSNSGNGYTASYVRKKSVTGMGLIPDFIPPSGEELDRFIPQEFPAYYVGKNGKVNELTINHDKVKDMYSELNLLPSSKKTFMENVMDETKSFFQQGQRKPQSEEAVIDLREPLEIQYNIEEPDYEPSVRVLTPLSEEEMDMYEIDPEMYERTERRRNR